MNGLKWGCAPTTYAHIPEYDHLTLSNNLMETTYSTLLPLGIRKADIFFFPNDIIALSKIRMLLKQPNKLDVILRDYQFCGS